VSVCPSCSATYQADSFQLLAAGLRGGKGVPETVAAHPRLFVTFTAPSFGQVHTRKAQGPLIFPCHPYRQGQQCPHGRRAGCWQRHDEDDPRLGEPLCARCYQTGAQVLWNALAGRLWSRTTIYLYRTLAQLAGMTEAELRRAVRISFAKVAEYQRRGAVHFHAIIRLDAATDCGCPACVMPPPPGFTAELLEEAVRQTAASVAVPCPALDEDQGVTLVARWGEQLDVRQITEAGDDDRELSAEQVAGYVAKYATKSTEALGVTLDRRIGEVELEGLDVPAHVAELVHACLELGARPSLARLRLRKWAHMLGFGGHFSTKSRRYSTTLGALRRARVTYAIRRRGDTLTLDAWGRPEDDQAVIVIASWSYLGSGYQTTGEAWLAASAAARAREERRIAKEELRTTTVAA